jgi:hypothetical protein
MLHDFFGHHRFNGEIDTFSQRRRSVDSANLGDHLKNLVAQPVVIKLEVTQYLCEGYRGLPDLHRFSDVMNKWV